MKIILIVVINIIAILFAIGAIYQMEGQSLALQMVLPKYTIHDIQEIKYINKETMIKIINAISIDYNKIESVYKKALYDTSMLLYFMIFYLLFSVLILSITCLRAITKITAMNQKHNQNNETQHLAGADR